MDIQTKIENNEMKNTLLESNLFHSFGQISLKNSNQFENSLKNSDILENFYPKNIDFEDHPDELIKNFDVMLNQINTPEDLITATHKINEFRIELEHPLTNDFIKGSSNFQIKREEINFIEKFNKFFIYFS